MIFIDDHGKEHKYTFGNAVTGRPAREIIISIADLSKHEPSKTIDYIQTILASSLEKGGKITIVLE